MKSTYVKLLNDLYKVLFYLDGHFVVYKRDEDNYWVEVSFDELPPQLQTWILVHSK